MTKPSKRLMCALALGSAALYIYSAGPSLVPYRDAGEMATTVSTLGILHPTSYPVYSILGHLFSRLPLGNPAYRLNIFSSYCMAAGWAMLFIFLAETFNAAVGFLTVLLGVVSYQFWTHALVSEMYSLNFLFLVSILLALHKQQWLTVAFLGGLGLANRPDLLLIFPAFGCLLYDAYKKSKPASLPWGMMVLFFTLGMSAYLYLPLRALQHPVLNWNDPSTLDRLFRTLLRRGYGSTLDLLSASYATGENFNAEIILYGKHLLLDFMGVGVIIALIGTIFLYQRKRVFCVFASVGMLGSGVLFIFLGNLPPNPHAVAIVEAGYLNPDVFFLVLMAAGLSWIFTRWPKGVPVFVGFFICATLSSAMSTYPQVSRRSNFLAVDYARNVFASVPENSFVVARSDVPLFSLFYAHWIFPKPPLRWPLAQGLLGSSWYQHMMKEETPGLELTTLKTSADWSIFSQANPAQRIFATGDVDWPSDAANYFQAKGLVNAVPSTSLHEKPFLLQADDLFIRRGNYHYSAYRDFFSSELVEQYSKADLSLGQAWVPLRNWSQAQNAFLSALNKKPDQPYAAMSLAYTAYQRGDIDGAIRYYEWAAALFERILAYAETWKSFDSTKAALKRDEALAVAQWAVTEEQRGNAARSLELYDRALKIDPTSSDAHYNMAVFYWKQGRWGDVVEHLQAMAKDHPEDPRWKNYLPSALEKLRRAH